MKLNRSEFQKYIYSYEEDETFYRDLYFAEKIIRKALWNTAKILIES